MVGDLLAVLSRHRRLTWELAKREIGQRYAGQLLGRFWALGHPLALMALYLFVFAVVLELKIGGTKELPLDYATYLLAGLIPWLAFQETLSKSATVIHANASLVKQVVFPIEVLPIKGVLVALLTQLIATAVLIAYVLVRHGALPWTYGLLPLLLVLHAVALVGLAYLVSAVAVYVRDTKDLVQLFATVGLYVMPIFYLPDWVPEALQPILYINPFSYLVWCFQDACYFGRIEHPIAWVVFPAMALLIFLGGYAAFRRLKPTFANVL